MKFLKIDQGYFWIATDEEVIDPQFNPKWILMPYNGTSYILKLIAHGPNHIRAVPYYVTDRHNNHNITYYIRQRRITDFSLSNGIIDEWEHLAKT